MSWIAEEHVVFVSPDGQRVSGRIAVGQPYVDEHGCVACAVALDGLDRGGPISGHTSLQALLLGVRFLGTRLHEFIESGGRVHFPDEDTDVPLDALFGPLLSAAAAS